MVATLLRTSNGNTGTLIDDLTGRQTTVRPGTGLLGWMLARMTACWYRLFVGRFAGARVASGGRSGGLSHRCRRRPRRDGRRLSRDAPAARARRWAEGDRPGAGRRAGVPLPL